MSQYMTYIVAQGDTLDSISQSQLGSEQVDAIIQLNKLRYPYVSDDPYDQFAMPKGTLQIQGVIDSGVSLITLGNNNALTVNPMDTIFIQDRSTGLSESLVVSSVNQTSNSISISVSTPIKNNYSQSSIATLFVDQQNITTKVLKTGDTLYLPVTAPNVYSISQQTSDIFGTDIALDENGFIERTNTGWDTVSGMKNLNQAIRKRWKTPIGGLPSDTTYGNGMWGLIGESNKDYYWQLSKSYAEQSARSDPRVANVTNVFLVASQDNQILHATIQPVNTPTGFVVTANLPIGGA